MGRHSNGHRNLSVTREMWISLAAALLVLAVGVWWFFNRADANSEHDQAGDCPAGDLTLLVAANKDDAQIQALLDSYAKSKPVVKDHCIRTEVVADVANSALALLPGTTETVNARLTAAGRTASTDVYPVAIRTPLGIAELDGQANAEKENTHNHEHGTATDSHDHAHEGHTHTHDHDSWTALGSHGVAVPAKNATFYSAVAATALSGGDPDRATNMLRENAEVSLDDAAKKRTLRIATIESETPEGYTFESPEDLHVTTLAIPLTALGSVTEDESRAAAHFARFVAENVEQTKPTHNETLLYSTAQVVSEKFAAQPTMSPDERQAKDTMILLDTSEAMAETMGDQSVFNQTIQLIEPHILKVGEKGGHTALWNYSSPLNPGITKGWRSNVPFTDQSKGQNVVSAMKQFGLGGEPWTRSSALAAMAAAGENTRVTGTPTHIILVTSGTADRVSVHELWDELEAFHDADVHLHVIHVGDDQVDESLATWAKEHFGSAVKVNSPQELSRELDRAFADSFIVPSPTSGTASDVDATETTQEHDHDHDHEH